MCSCWKCWAVLYGWYICCGLAIWFSDVWEFIVGFSGLLVLGSGFCETEKNTAEERHGCRLFSSPRGAGEITQGSQKKAKESKE